MLYDRYLADFVKNTYQTKKNILVPFIRTGCFVSFAKNREHMNSENTLKGAVIVKWKFASNGNNRCYEGIRYGEETETSESINRKHVSTEEKEDVLMRAEDIENTPVDFQRRRILDALNDPKWNWLPEETDTFERDVDAFVSGK